MPGVRWGIQPGPLLQLPGETAVHVLCTMSVWGKAFSLLKPVKQSLCNYLWSGVKHRTYNLGLDPKLMKVLATRDYVIPWEKIIMLQVPGGK